MAKRRKGCQTLRNTNITISKNTYLVGGGSKSDVWSKLLASALNRPIIVGEDANLGPALGVARLAMLATKDFEKKMSSRPKKKIFRHEMGTKKAIYRKKTRKVWTRHAAPRGLMLRPRPADAAAPVRPT
mgnify:CR=1 FL=1